MANVEKAQRPKYTVDENVIKEIQAHYAKILDQAALNVSNPLAANIGYFNTNNKVIVDDPRVGKTLIFMTRPNLNLRNAVNIRGSRFFNYFNSTKLGKTLLRYLMFGPTADCLVWGKYPETYPILKTFKNKIPIIGKTDDTVIGGEKLIEGENCYPIIHSNFVPFVTNFCISSSPSKDLTMETFETEGNFNGDKLVYAGGLDENYSVGEITLNFSDKYGNPVLIYFMAWMMYMHYVSKGIINPEWAYIVNRIIDYSCSIYVFTLGTDQQTILGWNKFGGSFPRSLPLGMIQHSTEIDQKSFTDISIPFQYNFSNPMDSAVLTEFNMISSPSLYYRFTHAKFYKPEYKSECIKILEGQTMSLHDAMKIREYCPPTELPDKLLEIPAGVSMAENFSLDEENYLDPYSTRRLLLKNRQADNIENHFAGVPYICEGNRLLWL